MRPRGETVSTHPKAAGQADVARRGSSKKIPGCCLCNREKSDDGRGCVGLGGSWGGGGNDDDDDDNAQGLDVDRFLAEGRFSR